MQRFLLFVVLAVASVAAVVMLQNATKTEPDPVVASSRSIVAFEVTTNGFVDSADPGDTLWGACQASMQSSTLDLSEVGGEWKVCGE